MAELLVYCGLVGAVLSCVYFVFIAGLKWFTAGENAVLLQRACATALTRLTRDLQETNVLTIQTSTNPPGISFASPRNTLGAYNISSGAMQWRKFICYYVDTSDARYPLIRKELAIGDTSSPPTNQLTNMTVARFASVPLPQTIVAQNISTLTVSVTDKVVTITLVAQARDSQGNLVTMSNGVVAHSVQLSGTAICVRN